ncbi:hypothetical protein HY495_00180 [Candidatus Woesearchaeota archaeon]|nr:hypothetical protein [Candidatus Woesearchaeota archaeon]
MSQTKNYPDFQTVQNWNSKVSLTVAPAGTAFKESGAITKAWVNVFSIMPAVTENETLLVPQQGNVLIGANYQIVLPTNTQIGDCKTTRKVVEKSEKIDLYVNGKLQGTGENVKYAISANDGSSVLFNAVYNVWLKIEIGHYKLQQKSYYHNGKKDYYYSCEYYNTDYQTNAMSVWDSRTATISSPMMSASFTVQDKYLDTTKGTFTATNYVNTELHFFDSSLMRHNYVFSEVLDKKGILTVKVEKLFSQDENNLATGGDIITVPSTDGCSIKLSDFFTSKILPCTLTYDSPAFAVTTDKNVYDENETITVTISPAGREYTVQYAEQEFSTTGTITLKAEYPYNKITVQYKDRILPLLVHIKNEKPLHTAFSLVFFGFTNQAIIGLVRRYCGGVHD